MDKNIRIQNAIVNQKLFPLLLDILITIVTTIVLYFVILYAVFATSLGYIDRQNQIDDFHEKYQLDLKEGLSYQEYELVLKDFYLVQFPEEIKNNFNENRNKDYSINHIYNITVLKLHDTPTYDNYKTDYHAYVQNDKGIFDPNIIADKVAGSGKNYERNMSDLYYNSYSKLKDILFSIDENYQDLVVKTSNYKTFSRTLAFLISVIIYFVIIPLKNKYGSTIMEQKYKLGHVNKKDGYIVKKFKIILRPIIYFLIPLIAIFLGSMESIIIILVGYLFINFLLLLFSEKNMDLADKMLNMDTCLIEESLLFYNEAEEKIFVESEEFKQINDIDYLNKLTNTKNIKPILNQDKQNKSDQK